MSDILLGSETYELTVTCSRCGRTEIMYIPTGTEVTDVQRFLIGRGWLALSGGQWACPSEVLSA